MFAYMRRGPNFYKEVTALAAPIILQDMITSTLSMADTFMVGLLGLLGFDLGSRNVGWA